MVVGGGVKDSVGNPASDYLNHVSGPGFQVNSVREISHTFLIWNFTGAEMTRLIVKRSKFLTGVFSSPLAISRVLSNLSLLFS